MGPSPLVILPQRHRRLLHLHPKMKYRLPQPLHWLNLLVTLLVTLLVSRPVTRPQILQVKFPLAKHPLDLPRLKLRPVLLPVKLPASPRPVLLPLVKLPVKLPVTLLPVLLHRVKLHPVNLLANPLVNPVKQVNPLLHQVDPRQLLHLIPCRLNKISCLLQKRQNHLYPVTTLAP